MVNVLPLPENQSKSGYEINIKGTAKLHRLIIDENTQEAKDVI